MSYVLRIRTRTHGALFDARAHRYFDDFADDLEQEGAEYALGHIRQTYHTHFKHPTGFYESNVRVHDAGGSMEVWDGGYGGPVYGPWLEGVGSRNRTTRFKGYHAFRKAASALERRVEGMGDRLLYRNVIWRL